MAAINAPGISAASLALVFVHVNPATFKRACKDIRIFLAGDFQRFFDEFHRVFVFEASSCSLTMEV